MDQLHATVDKLFTEVDHLERIIGDDGVADDRVELALSVAKRVRRETTALVRCLAQQRDGDSPSAQP